MQTINRTKAILWLTVVGLVAALATPAAAQEDYEYNPREGLHEQEWYDPGDWFDGNGELEYDYDWWDSGYGYEPYGYGYGPYGYGYPGYYPYYPYGYYERDEDYDYYGFDWDLDQDWWWNEEEQQTRDAWQIGQRAQIYGEIENLQLITDTRSGEAHMGALVMADSGALRSVVFGPFDRVRDLDIEVGDEVNVIGQVENVNGHPTLVARQFSTDDFRRWIHIQRPIETSGYYQTTRYYRGEVLDVRAVQFRGLDERHVVARLRLDDGSTVQANLGPASDIPRENIQSGDQISLDARTGRINRQTALIAERVRLNGNTIAVDRESERQRFQREQQQRESRADRQRNRAQEQQTGQAGR